MFLGRTNAGRERAMNLFWSIRMLASSPMVPSPAPGRERVCMMGTWNRTRNPSFSGTPAYPSSNSYVCAREDRKRYT